MKIENRWFQLTWEKKKRGGTFLPLLLCVALLAGSFGGGLWLGSRSGASPAGDEDMQVAGGQNDGSQGTDGQLPQGDIVDVNDPGIAGEVTSDWDDGYVEGTYVTSSYLAGSVKEKYRDGVSPYGYTYGPAITGLKRDEMIVLQAGFDVMNSEYESWTEIAELFQDPQLTHSADNRWQYDSDTNTITLTPNPYDVGMIYVEYLDTETVRRYEHDSTLFPHDAESAWGNIGTMYLAVYVDLETGEKLDIPQVQVVTLEGELPDTPQLSYSFTDDGRIRFSWTQVEGAEEYFIGRIDYTESQGLHGNFYTMGTTTDTEWTFPAPQYGSSYANEEFRNYVVAENDWYSDWQVESTIQKYGEEPVNIYNEDRREVYCVIAVCREGTSMVSNYVDILDIQSNIPVKIASDTWKANGYKYGNYDALEELPAYAYVTMADGSTAMKLVDYDTENAVVVEDRYIFLDDDGNYLEGRNVKLLKIPYRIEGTPFEDMASVEEYDDSGLEGDLRYIEEREDMLRKRGGDVALNGDIAFDEEEAVAEEVRQVEEIPVTANSALSEYLALNMLSGVTIIDVSEFEEAADTNLLVDALLEAYYQNPLILGINGYKVNRRGTAIKISYEESAQEQARKQQEIQQKVEQVIGDIITPGMTELEKELAINEYLCATCTYDDAALENAEKNDYMYVDESFNDSFTAYGALINGRCVCAGYAAAFKLLANAAGLECIVVTGALEGTLPHAWNKVRIDGDWEILDVTNNDTEFLSNALLNLSDSAGRNTLVEDSDYVMDAYLKDYASTNDQKEYYRVNEMYYSYDEIAEKLAEQLEENGTALLRTEYGLDDETFDKIGNQVYEALGGEGPLYGYYWLGVIYLTR